MTWIMSAVCLIGTVLNVKKMKVCFCLWAVGNLGWLAYDVWSGLYSRATLDTVQLALAVWGIVEWNKEDE